MVLPPGGWQKPARWLEPEVLHQAFQTACNCLTGLTGCYCRDSTQAYWPLVISKVQGCTGNALENARPDALLPINAQWPSGKAFRPNPASESITGTL
jgi:hypothetical protein